MKKPTLGHLIDEMMPILGLLEGDPMYEEIEVLPKHGGGGAPGMFYFKYNGVKARADHKPHWAKTSMGTFSLHLSHQKLSSSSLKKGVTTMKAN